MYLFFIVFFFLIFNQKNNLTSLLFSDDVWGQNNLSLTWDHN